MALESTILVDIFPSAQMKGRPDMHCRLFSTRDGVAERELHHIYCTSG